MKNLRNEYGEPCEYKGEEAYSEIVFFGEDNDTELYVTTEIVDFDESLLTSDQVNQVWDYAHQVQREIREWEMEREDDRVTHEYLYNTAHW